MTTHPATPPLSSGDQPEEASATRKPSFWHYGLYFVVTLASLGTLAWVPIADAATRLRRRWLFGLAMVYALAGTAEAILYLASVDTAVTALLMVLLVVSGVVVQVFLVRELQRTETRQPQPSTRVSTGR
ncbi:MAG TPA: hypothetical protein VH969_23540 [Actinophytocola sp.]|jgi:hypothetical protein|uniref:hypothetical protein n=1 Tax=Actinophytocola sp. TaxID=1872138 RepID=UPI002F92937B